MAVHRQLALVALLLVAAGADKKPPSPGARRNDATAARTVARSTGTVVGLLRYKGCQTPAEGATVTVIGRKASAKTDIAGVFTFSLYPGTYSLAIGGPNLVADQRVDDVEISVGETLYLGLVEVWPEEQPAKCLPPPAPDPDAEPLVAVAPETPWVDLPGAGVEPTRASPEQVIVRGHSGSELGQFGLEGDPTRDDEDALGPSSFDIGPQGSLFVLDALNMRVQRFDRRGKPAASFPLVHSGGDWPPLESDIAVSADGDILVFSDGEPAWVAQYDQTGRFRGAGALPASLSAVDFLFAGKKAPILLMANGQAIRAGLGSGNIEVGSLLPGLPVGDRFVRAERVSRWRAALKLLTADGRVSRSVQLRSHVPVTGVRMVGVNRTGDFVVAVDRADGETESAPEAEVLLLQVTPRGRLAGSASVAPGDRRFEFREFALAPDGSVVQMQSDATEVRFVRWTLHPSTRELLSGEGLVKGRVLEGGRPRVSAVAVSGRTRRSVTVAPDGTFEVRLPAGSYVMTLRRSSKVGGDAPAVEVKVVVAAGATVDLGNVSVVPRSANRGGSTPIQWTDPRGPADPAASTAASDLP